jgi:hypothetical protein
MLIAVRENESIPLARLKATSLSRVVFPLLLVGGILASVLLWVPFGMGFYGWPWQYLGWRVALYCFVFAFPVGSAAGCIAAFRGGFSYRRFALPFVALIVGIFGMVCMLDWLTRYVGPMLQGSYPHP